MFCQACGYQAEEGAVICPHCGAVLTQNSAGSVSGIEIPAADMVDESAESTVILSTDEVQKIVFEGQEKVKEAPVQEKKKKHAGFGSNIKNAMSSSKKDEDRFDDGGEEGFDVMAKLIQYKNVLIGAAAAVVVIILVVALASGKKYPTFNLYDYITWEATGNDGDGKLTVVFDDAKLAKDVEGYVGESIQSSSVTNADEDAASLSERIVKDYIEVSSLPVEGISNGDTVVIYTSYNDSRIKSYGFKVKGGSKKVKISGLGEQAAAETK